MARSAKFPGIVADVPVGSPDDPPHEGEFFPSGDYGDGFIRRSLPSEFWLDRMIYPKLQGRESGYLPEPTTPAEAANRVLRRSMRINEGNATGQYPGRPDRVRK